MASRPWMVPLIAAVCAACSSSDEPRDVAPAPQDASADDGGGDASADGTTADSATDGGQSEADAGASPGDATSEGDPDPLHGFAVDVSGGRVVVRAPGGRVLLDGLGATAGEPGDPPRAGFAVREQVTNYTMMFGSFKPDTVGLGAWRGATQVTEQALTDGKRIELADSQGALLARLVVRSPVVGHLAVAVEPGDGPERRMSWGFACDAEDHFAGFGAQTWDVDHRGQTVASWVQEEGIGKIETDSYDDMLWYLAGRRHSSHMPIPQYLSRRGYILTAETDGRAVFALCSEQPSEARVEVDVPLTIHLFDGPEPARAIERATAQFGRPRRPPVLAFAPWLDALHGPASVLGVAQTARAEGIPSSVIWTEDWRGGSVSMMGSYDLKEEWEVDPELYPDLTGMTASLHQMGYAFFAYFNPFVFEGSKAWSETASQGWLIRDGNGEPYTFQAATIVDSASMLDVTHPGARAWALGKMKSALAQGVDGWMTDFGEWLPTDAVLTGGSGLELHNRYPVLWQELSREAIDSVKDGSPRLFFARAGWFGTPGLADVIWAGDQKTNLDVDDGMPVLIPIGVGLGLVGISTYGHDIAGYNSTTVSPSTKEVFFRWTSLGAWTPVMRTHHGNYPNDNWAWDRDAETTAHFRRYSRLHMALLPVWEGLAKTASDSGLPIWRGMALQYPEDATVWPITDQVMVGDGILVAPVQKEGATSREVYLPAGRWYAWEGDGVSTGPATIEAQAGVGEIPVYARAGAVVPMLPDGVVTVFRGSPAVPDAASVGDDRVVRVFLGADGEFREASGLRYAVEQVAVTWQGPLTYFWNGVELGACGLAPCAQVQGSGARLSVIGPGTASVRQNGAEIARVKVEGGSLQRRVELQVRE